MARMKRLKKTSRDLRFARSFSTQAPRSRSTVTFNAANITQTTNITGAAAGCAMSVAAIMAIIQSKAATAAESARP